MKPIFRSSVSFLIFSLLFLPAMGCGKSKRPTAKLTGKVTLNGKPVDIGSVLVVSEDGKEKGEGAITKGGEYQVAAAPTGKVKIAVIPPPPLPEEPPGLKGKKLIKGPDMDPEVLEAMKSVKNFPAVFVNIETSNITYDMKEGENNFDIKLAGKK